MNGNYDEELEGTIPKLLAELAHIIKYDDYAYERNKLVQFAFEDDIDSDTGLNLHIVKIITGLFKCSDFIEFESITTAPKVGKKTIFMQNISAIK